MYVCMDGCVYVCMDVCRCMASSAERQADVGLFPLALSLHRPLQYILCARLMDTYIADTHEPILTYMHPYIRTYTHFSTHPYMHM